MSEEHIIETRNGSSWQLPAIIVLGLVAIAGLGFGWNASAKLDSTQQAVTTEVKTAQQAEQQDMSSLKDRIAQDEKANSDLQGDLKVVTDKLKITQGQLKKARLATEAAAKQNDETTQKLSALDTSVHTELATKAATDDVKNVDTKVTAVSADLNTTKEDLKMAKSEMGTLIARNHDEIDQLRRLGERDYVEFTIAGKNKPQKVGNVTVELKGVNEKKNQVNIAMTVEDKRFEKKNRALNEPIFFYISGTHIPEEIVVNKVGKDQISGYVSIPKANSQPPALPPPPESKQEQQPSAISAVEAAKRAGIPARFLFSLLLGTLLSSLFLEPFPGFPSNSAKMEARIAENRLHHTSFILYIAIDDLIPARGKAFRDSTNSRPPSIIAAFLPSGSPAVPASNWMNPAANSLTPTPSSPKMAVASSFLKTIFTCGLMRPLRSRAVYPLSALADSPACQ